MAHASSKLGETPGTIRMHYSTFRHQDRCIVHDTAQSSGITESTILHHTSHSPWVCATAVVAMQHSVVEQQQRQDCREIPSQPTSTKTKTKLFLYSTEKTRTSRNNLLRTAMVSWLPLLANSAEAAAEASFRTVTCPPPQRAR